MTPDPRDGSRKPERSTLLTVEEARAWAIAIAKEINRDAPRRPLGEFIAELRRKQAAQPLPSPPKVPNE